MAEPIERKEYLKCLGAGYCTRASHCLNRVGTEMPGTNLQPESPSDLDKVERNQREHNKNPKHEP
jgi:hypothetical protein